MAIEAGWVIGTIVKGASGQPAGARLDRLTMDGHDFLDNARNETVWKSAREKLTDFGGACSLDVFKKLLGKIATDQLLG